MALQHELSRQVRRLPYYIALGSVGLAVSSAPALAAASRADRRSHNLQLDMNTLAHRAYTDSSKKLGISAMRFGKHGNRVKVDMRESAPTSYGSDHGGSYSVDFITDYSPRKSVDLSTIHSITISEGTLTAKGLLTAGMQVKADMNTQGGTITELRYPFNETSPSVSSASLQPGPHGTRTTEGLLEDWYRLSQKLLTGVENQTPTGPLPLDWHDGPKGL